MIEFKKYEGIANLEDLGTLADQIGAKGTIKFSKPNFLNAEKRVVVIAENGEGLSAVISCSTNLSKHLRTLKANGTDKKELLAFVAGLNVLENEAGVAYITMPGGEPTEGFKIAELKKVKVNVAITNPEELAW